MANQFKWGIIGLGKIAHKFAQALAVVPDAQLYAVASRSLERAQKFAQEYSAPNAYGSYQEIVLDKQIQAIYIATPHTSHCELTLMCLEAGIPVLCEKPWAMHTKEAEQMVAMAQGQQTFLMEAIWTRFLPTTKAVLSLIDEGAIGKVLGLKADFGFKPKPPVPERLLDPGLGGGALLDIGIYPAFLAQLLLGDPVEIQAQSVLSEKGVDLDTGYLLGFKDNRLAHLHCTLLSETRTEALIYGEKGRIHIHGRWHEPSSFSLLLDGEQPQLYQYDYPVNGYYYEAERVMECVQQGLTECPELPLDFSLRLTRLLDRIRDEAGISYPH